MPQRNKTHFSHPGAILKREFLDEIGLRPGTLARLIGVDRSRVKAIIEGKRDITADTALRLGKFLGTTPDFWMNLQSHYNLAVAAGGAKRDISQIHPWRDDARVVA
ncbi:MAG TPA: HigA family addiction module antitoxin [Humisphaera sp.]|nr:HigA family addiction module antitoxin [Humisphaera sp.]